MNDKLETVLVESTLAGDIESFGKLCSHYYKLMVAVAYSVLGDHHLAEDAAQETFAKALGNLSQLREKEKFASWLTQICKNTAKDWTKMKSRQISSEDLSQIPDCQNNNDDGSIKVKEAISRLPAGEKELVVLRYYTNLSYEEMSAVLGLSKAAINGKLHRAKERVAKHLKLNGFSEVL